MVRRRLALTRRPAATGVARAIVAALVLAVPASGWWSPAGAHGRVAAQAAACDEVVIDDAHVLADPAAVAAAAGQVSDTTGALVRVRVVASLDGHDAETHRRLMEEGCPSWSTDGHRDARLLLVMVAPTERKTTVAYGSSWTDRLLSGVGALQRDHMDAHFKAGDFDAGLTDGLAALGERLRAGPIPASPPYTVDLVPPTFAAPVPGRGSDVGGLAVVLFLAVVGVGVLSVALGGARRSSGGWGGPGSGGRGFGFSRFGNDDRRSWWGTGSSGSDSFGSGTSGSDSFGSGTSGSDSFGSGSFGSDSSSSGGDGGSNTTSW
jgi:hypothetical protein